MDRVNHRFLVLNVFVAARYNRYEITASVGGLHWRRCYMLLIAFLEPL